MTLIFSQEEARSPMEGEITMIDDQGTPSIEEGELSVDDAAANTAAETIKNNLRIEDGA